MNNTVEPTVEWSQDQMVEVLLNEPDDFLKVRETLTRIGVASRKEKSYISPATSYINKEDTSSFTLKELFALDGNTPILLLMMYSAVTALLVCLLTGDSLR